MASQENIPPEVTRRIMKELGGFEKQPLEGIKVSVRDDDITDITAIIDGPADTPFEGGAFKCRLKLGDDFPRAPPKAFFVTKIFHPNVSSKGEICVSTLKKDWKEDLGISHILLTIKCLLIVPNPESALNEEASRLMLDKYEDYFKHAKMYTSIHATPSSAPASPAPADAAPAKATEPAKAKEAKVVAAAKDKKKSLKRL
eukprot:TRINITY_DN5068_c0_g1_i2.p1 TRINITY_DN5068_c0_g1~~TRINITY_DN5068_c0_g1_i2.p1  ORF type:complete len:208 (+),score=40.58 TRINITY_DN5068_c0_g1_i2:27-626(+)